MRVCVVYDPAAPELPSLPGSGGLRVVGWLPRTEEFAAALAPLDAELVLLDLRCAGERTAELVARTLAAAPSARVLVLGAAGDDDAERQALRAGAAGYATRDATRVGLVHALGAVARGGIDVSAAASPRFARPNPAPAPGTPVPEHPRGPQVAIVTCEGAHEVGASMLAHILGRAERDDFAVRIVHLAATTPQIGGDEAALIERADVVVFTGGAPTGACLDDAGLLDRVRVDPARQLLASQCAGALFLARLGLLRGRPVCADAATRPLLEALGIQVLERSFAADDALASAGGCFAAPYLAAWLLWRCLGRAAAAAALDAVAPVGQRRDFVERTLAPLASILHDDAPLRRAYAGASGRALQAAG